MIIAVFYEETYDEVIVLSVIADDYTNAEVICY